MRNATKWLIGVGGLLGLLAVVGWSSPAWSDDKDKEKPKTAEKDKAKEKEPTPGFHKLTLDGALKQAEKDRKIVMVDFYADWCGPCRMLDAKTWKDEKVQTWLKDKTVAIKVDVDVAMDLAKKHKITGIPALVFFKPDGTEAGRIVGYHDPDAFLQKAADVVAGKKSDK